MLPNLLSSTMNLADLLGKNEQNNDNNSQKETGEQNKADSATGKIQPKAQKEKEAGRPEKADDQKSEKTIQNKESMS